MLCKSLNLSLDPLLLIRNNEMKGLDEGISNVHFRTKTILEL